VNRFQDGKPVYQISAKQGKSNRMARSYFKDQIVATDLLTVLRGKELSGYLKKDLKRLSVIRLPELNDKFRRGGARSASVQPS